MSHSQLEKILSELPKLHCGDTEILRTVSRQETILRGSVFESVANNLPACYSVEPVLARFLYESVSEDSKTLETGSGISTLVFALRHSNHIAITPSSTEVGAIRAYANANEIPLDRVEFVIEPSERYLPRCESHDLDLVLIDGKHAFPWPILDWFYTADKLKQGGIVARKLLPSLATVSVSSRCKGTPSSL
jgi:predicted O-methyltransferase YrrM